MTEPLWVIATVRTMSEDIVERAFLFEGYRTYVPRYRCMLAPHGARRSATATMRPLLPGIVFVQDWRGWPKRAISGIVGLMRRGQTRNPATLSGTDIATIQQRERQGAFDRGLRPPAAGVLLRDDLAIGERIECEIAGQEIAGILNDLTPNGKATITAIIMGRETVIHGVEAAELRAVGQ